ncbi:hypothetical protein LINGRAHAP2_LOCUS3032 [Linum grandiflorum]
MGNCLQRNKLRSQVHQEAEEDINIKQYSSEYYLKEDEIKEEEKPTTAAVNVKKVKILLTKEELEWLMFQVNNAKKIEDALAEIQRSRGAPLKPVDVVFDFDEDEDEDEDEDSCNWRPSLETIPEEEEEEEQESGR